MIKMKPKLTTQLDYWIQNEENDNIHFQLRNIQLVIIDQHKSFKSILLFVKVYDLQTATKLSII